MHTNSRLLFEKHALPLLQRNMTVLEIGPDAFPSAYQGLSAQRHAVWHTLDMTDDPRLTYANSAEYAFPIADDAYDVVLSGQVLEHVRKPWRWLPELARVTRAGGLVITINPVSWTYHEAPVDCWRIYPEGMRALYEEASLSVELSEWGTLETPHFRRHLGGISREHQSPQRRRAWELLGRFGFPVEAAYDTITIGRKPAAG